MRYSGRSCAAYIYCTYVCLYIYIYIYTRWVIFFRLYQMPHLLSAEIPNVFYSGVLRSLLNRLNGREPFSEF